jgi:hypothetical protein
MKSLTPPLIPSIAAEDPPPPPAAAAAEAAPELPALLDPPADPPPLNREVPEDRNPPVRPPLEAAEPPPALAAPAAPVPLNADATADVAADVVEDEPADDELEPPPPPPPDPIVTTIPPRPPPPPKLETDIPPPRPPRNCGATSEAYRSATVVPDNRIVRSSVPRVTGVEFTTTGPAPPPPPVTAGAIWSLRKYTPAPPAIRIATRINDFLGPFGCGTAGCGTTSGRGLGSGLRSGCIFRVLVSFARGVVDSANSSRDDPRL